MPKQKKPDESLKGWPAIAKFLSQPVSTVQRWANEGMPVTRIGRYVAASPAQLERWLTREAGTKETVHIPADNADLTADLKRGLSEVRKTHRKGRPSQLILHEPGNRHNERGTSFSTSLINSDGRLRKA